MLFRIKDSTFHSDWKIGKVGLIDVKRDNFVRGVSISYKVINVDKDEPRHMVVQRPVKQIFSVIFLPNGSLNIFRSRDFLQAIFRGFACC